MGEVKSVVTSLKTVRSTFASGTKQPERECDDKIIGQGRADGPARALSAINDRDIICVHLPSDAKLAILLQQSVIKRACGIRFPPEDCVLNATTTRFEHLAFDLFQLLDQSQFLSARGLIFSFDRLLDELQRPFDLL